jgi:MFS family permease
MRQLVVQFRSFDRPSRLLMVNQFTINVGFYMLMPYLASYLAGPLGLAAWTVGLVLGIRNFSQQGMFLVGGTLADRFGYKPLIVAGCLLRTGGFALLAIVASLPGLIVALAATGFAGALFNPAVRAYLAADSRERRIEAFAVFNVFYQAGILAGPVVGLALTTLDFRLTCLVAAAVFAILSIIQIRALPAQPTVAAQPERRDSMLTGLRMVASNRPFTLFALVMIGCYVLSFQMYLALPMEAQRIAGSGAVGTALITALFVISGGLAIVGQLKITAWLKARWSPGTCLAAGMSLMALAFVAPGAAARAGSAVAAAALMLSAAMLALGTIAVFPFEMDTIVRFSEGKLVATHYGFYNTVVGVGILLGNLFTGTVFDLARSVARPELPWIGLVTIGAGCALGLLSLNRHRQLQTASALT